MQAKNLTNFLMEGDSLMMGGGTGWGPVFRELLGNVGDAKEFSPSGLLQVHLRQCVTRAVLGQY